MERKEMGVTQMEGEKVITGSCLPTSLLPESVCFPTARPRDLGGTDPAPLAQVWSMRSQ